MHSHCFSFVQIVLRAILSKSKWSFFLTNPMMIVQYTHPKSELASILYDCITINLFICNQHYRHIVRAFFFLPFYQTIIRRHRPTKNQNAQYQIRFMAIDLFNYTWPSLVQDWGCKRIRMPPHCCFAARVNLRSFFSYRFFH